MRSSDWLIDIHVPRTRGARGIPKWLLDRPHDEVLTQDVYRVGFNTDFGDAFEREGDSRAYFDESPASALPSASTRSSTR